MEEMMRREINFNKYKNNLFYQDGKIEKTWKEAHEIVKKMTYFFYKNGFKKNDIIAIDINKDFYTYCTILACYVYGVTFAPLRFDEIDEPLSVCENLDIVCFLSSSNTSLKEFFLIADLFENIEKNDNKKIIQLKEDLNSNAYILHSSGSTGSPKIIPIKYNNLHSYIASVNETSSFDVGSTFAQTVELTFDLSIHDLFLCFHHGGSIIPLSPNMAKLAPRFINSFKVNHLMIVPSFISAMEGDNLKLNSVKNVFFCGEALGTNTAKKAISIFPNAKIFNFYGPTETTVAVSYFQINSHDFSDVDIVPIGLPFSGTTFRLSKEQELLIGGNQVFDGYLNTIENNPFITIDGQRFYRSGDICSFDGKNFNFISRIDFQIKFRGYRVELEGIEALLSNKFKGSFGAIGYNEISSSNFADLAVFYTDVNLSPTAMKSSLPKHLNGIVFKHVDSIPRNASGKIDRKKLIK